MPRFAANVSMLFADVPFLDRFERAAQAGFEAVECQFPYAHRADEIKARLRSHRLKLVLHNLPAGDWARGERGLACLPGRVDEFRAGVRRGIDYAQVLEVAQLNCVVGKAPPGVADRLLRGTLIANLRYAAAELKAAGLKLLLEPINDIDMPGFYLTRSRDALAILDEVAADNAFLQYDIYHAQRMEGDLAATIERNLDRIAHMQLADNPGRHEPGTGEINFAFLFEHLDRIGYSGWIGCEYNPVGMTEAGLGWRERLTPGNAVRASP
jgi:hydroxypyruvate isomerase